VASSATTAAVFMAVPGERVVVLERRVLDRSVGKKWPVRDTV